MAYINDLLGNHEEEFHTLKSKVEDVLPKFSRDFYREDVCIFKFLVARDYNVAKAEELLRKHIEWRQENKIDHILKVQTPAAVWDTFPFVITGTDKRGCPVAYHPLGKWNGKKAVKMGWRQHCQTVLRQGGELMLTVASQLTTKERPVCQYYVIIDMEGFDLTQIFSIELVKMTREILQDYLDNFPELVSYIRVINAPKVYQLAWAVVEPILTGRTISKIEIYGTNKDEWKAKLLEEVGADNLPSLIGGSVTNAQTYKVEQGHGLDIFPKFKTLDNVEFEEVLIPARQKHIIEVNVRSGDEISWNFTTEDYDIGFQVDTTQGLKQQPIIEHARVDSHKFVQKGTLAPSDTTKYILTFDNSYSKFKGKKLRFALHVGSKNEE